MAEEDEEKTTFITSQGIFCYSKMSFELKNVRATYQRLVDKAFQKQIGRNLEVYVDDLVIKSRTEQEVIRDIKETFKTLREINMKLNPKKCTFGMREGMFLRYKVNADGLKVCPDKVEVVLSLPSPKCLKDVQKLNGKLASLNIFLSKSAEKSLPFFKTLKKCTKKSDFQWTTEAKMAFKQMKTFIAKLPMLTAPKEKKLIIYLAAAKEAISAVLMTEKDGKQIPIYFVSRALQGTQINYIPMEKLILDLKNMTFIIDQEHQSRIDSSIFHVERPNDYPPDTPIEDKEELPDPWILFTDGEAKYEALIAGLRIAEQMGVKNLQANVDSRLMANQVNETYVAKDPGMIKYLEKVKNLASTFKEFSIKQKKRKKAKVVRRKARRYAVTNGVLYKKSFLGPWLDCAGPLEANYVLREIHEGSCSMHTSPWSVVEKALRSGYYWSIMHADARRLIRECNDYQAHRTMIKSSNGETPFLLTYGTEAVILVEIGMPTLRTAEVDMIKNDEALEINLDLLEEKREQAAIQEARSKVVMEKYYNARVRNTSFKPGDLVYRSNEASHEEDGGKLGPKWEGPYKVTEALEKGAYKLRDRNENVLPRTWNVCNLKKCYVHEM
uniref:Reverse transcriptase domain-containing protein n=1 Tax=Tanacetum cinerariifolium TaxID=118510 RepID=A0A699HFV4_TANCI|nr:reverse transcriptase domain-containing protein [Tanacetum cinerariifolium]